LDYGNLFYFAWYMSLRDQVHSYGPPPGNDKEIL
jgi:hypothetical protein